jgi:D-methionine transport system ATP-binding protein
VLSRLASELGLELNILGGAVDEIAGRPFGTLVVSFAADPARLQQVRGFLEQRGLSSEVLGHVA